MELKQAVARQFGEEVAITVLRQVAFDAGIDLNRALSAKIRPKVELDESLKALLETGDEPEIKTIEPMVAVHAINLCTTALRDLASITEADDLGRKACPHGWLNGASNTTGRPHIPTVGTVLVDAVNFRATNSIDQSSLQIQTLAINGLMTEDQIETAKQANANRAASDANEALKARVALIPDWKQDYEVCRQMDLDQLAQDLEDTVSNLGWDLTDYVRNACAKSVDFAKERILAGNYTNLDPQVAALAA